MDRVQSRSYLTLGHVVVVVKRLLEYENLVRRSGSGPFTSYLPSLYVLENLLDPEHLSRNKLVPSRDGQKEDAPLA